MFFRQEKRLQNPGISPAWVTFEYFVVKKSFLRARDSKLS
jgi:hypothetical protein